MKAFICLLLLALVSQSFAAPDCAKICESKSARYQEKCLSACKARLPVILTEDEMDLAGKINWKKIIGTVIKILPKILSEENPDTEIEISGKFNWNKIFQTVLKVLPVVFAEATPESELDVAGKINFKKILDIVKKVLPIILSEEETEESDMELAGKIS